MASFVLTAQLALSAIVAFVGLSSSLAAASAAEKAAAAPLKIVKLQRARATLPQSTVQAGKGKNFYFAKVSVGTPAQEFRMAFDLGGGTMVLPSQDCVDSACLERRRYNKWTSDTAQDIQANGQLVEPNVPKTFLSRRDRGTLDLHSIDVGSGMVKGNFVRDQVCVHGEDEAEGGMPRCFPLDMLVANTMTDLPFLYEPYDGEIGLGLKGMSLSMEFNFLAGFRQGYANDLASNSFGLHIGGDENGGEITFGGYDVSRLTHPLKWANVADPDDGRWQVSIAAIRVGNSTLDVCKNRECHAALDYSSTLLNAPTLLAEGLESALEKLAARSGFGDGCQYTSIPDIHLDLTNDLTLTLPPEDFVNKFKTPTSLSSPKATCEPQLARHDAELPVGPQVFILGEATLRRYYTFYDADSLKVGFSLAKDSKALPDPTGSPQGKKAKKSEDAVILLVQVKWKRSKTAPSGTI